MDKRSSIIDSREPEPTSVPDILGAIMVKPQNNRVGLLGQLPSVDTGRLDTLFDRLVDDPLEFGGCRHQNVAVLDLERSCFAVGGKRIEPESAPVKPSGPT